MTSIIGADPIGLLAARVATRCGLDTKALDIVEREAPDA
jgi:NADPH-dependent 2,4-dienoyl-CoA reductase/sulfur reductase-like enzyme